MNRRLLFALAVFFLAWSRRGQAADTSSFSPPDHVWQWSVPAPSIPDRRAFLWISPQTARVRGLVVGLQNMLEKPLFERAAFRQACAENDLGIVMIFSGHDRIGEDDKNPDHPKRSALDIFLNPNYPKGDEDPQGAGEDLQKVLDALAAESGYPEIKFAPLMPVGHSSAGSFVWHLYRWDASRLFALMPFKTGIKTDGPQGIPIFNVESEWFDLGPEARDVWSKPSDVAHQLAARANGDASLFGFYVDLGNGHCDVSDDCLPAVRLFLKKAVAARIPANAPNDQPVALKPIQTASGWLLDPATFGKPGGRAIAYADWKGDPKKAFWYLDQELADYVQTHIAEQMAKKPQQVNFLKDGTAPAVAGMFSFSPKFIDDQGTFQVEAAFLDHLTKTDLFPPETRLEHSPTPIRFRVNSGALEQIGTNTFRILPHAGPIVPQGNPWEPTLVAYTEGDAHFRPTGRPAHVNVSIMNTGGEKQTLDFPKIPDQSVKTLQPIPLNAKASSGLPVQFFMVSGPATITDNTLTFSDIPQHTKFPIRVLVSAFQWGRPVDPKIQSAGPVTQEFFIQK